MLEYCCVVWHRGLAKTHVEQLEAVQRRAIRIVFGVTSNMSYQSAIAHANISSLQARRQELSQIFFRKTAYNPDNPLFDLLPPSREDTHTARLRSAHLLPVPRTCTTRY